VCVARGVPDHHVLFHQARGVLHEIGQAGDCLSLIGTWPLSSATPHSFSASLAP
jgi:hypothetical protein